MNVNNVAIEFEGVDKSGKDLICAYVAQLSNYKYTLNVRGILSQLVYNEKFNRGYTYTLFYKPVIFLFNVDTADHKIRCNLTNEKPIDIINDKCLFEKYALLLEKHGCIVYRFNTSKNSPFEIAKTICTYLESLNVKSFICDKPIQLT